MSRRGMAAAGLAAVLLAVLARGDECRLYLENDFPFHDDSDYTNGARAEWRHGWLAVFVEQLMYSPEDIGKPWQEGWRPYAGYLGAGVGAELDNDVSPRLRQLTYAEVQTGTLGPASMAEQTQKAIHAMVGARQPKGWDKQLGAEWEVQGLLRSGYEWLAAGSWDGWNIRLSGQLGAHVGTMQTAAEATALVRLGHGTATTHESNIETRSGQRRARPFVLYFEAGNETKWWDRNVFLDGTRDGEGPSVEKNPWTSAVRTGVVAQVWKVRLSVFCVYGTKEYETQRHSPDYASFQVGWDF